ncbi:MAG: tetratricopeptide repeat protein [Propionibacteriaceae bacterium]|jgi:tetratricopeptide (TPR) repeat protein|nr:tetratricopeptide repeat protein [Propionibacteriaceae bacterium]
MLTKDALEMVAACRDDEALNLITRAVDIYEWTEASRVVADHENFSEALLVRLDLLLKNRRLEEALNFSDLALGYCITLFDENQVLYEIRLGKICGSYRDLLFRFERYDESVEQAERAADYYGRVARRRPGEFDSQYAFALRSLAVVLSSAERHEEAVEVGEMATERYSKILEGFPGLNDILGAADNSFEQAKVLSWTGRFDEAIKGCFKSIEWYLSLASDYGLNLARELDSVLVALDSLIQDQEPSVELRRRYADMIEVYISLTYDNPELYAHKLLKCTQFFMRTYWLHGTNEVIFTCERVLEMCWDLSGARRTAFASQLAETLCEYASWSHEMRRDDALTYACRSVVVLEGLAEFDRESYATRLADSLNTCGWILYESGDSDSLSFFQRAMSVIEDYAAVDCEARSGKLAYYSAIYAYKLLDAGRVYDAIKYSQRAVDLVEARVGLNPENGDMDSAYVLDCHSYVLFEMGHLYDTLEPIKSAIEVAEKATTGTTQNAVSIIGYLRSYAFFLSEMNYHDDAVRVATLMIAHCEKLVLEWPHFYAIDLEDALDFYLDILDCAEDFGGFPDYTEEFYKRINPESQSICLLKESVQLLKSDDDRFDIDDRIERIVELMDHTMSSLWMLTDEAALERTKNNFRDVVDILSGKFHEHFTPPLSWPRWVSYRYRTDYPWWVVSLMVVRYRAWLFRTWL